MEQLVERLKSIKVEIKKLKSEVSKLENLHQQKEKENKRLKQLLDVQNSSIKELENKLKIKRIADEIVGDGNQTEESHRDLKFKINEMIKEVDKIVSLIHR
jgi:chromosome segregation ATPase